MHWNHSVRWLLPLLWVFGVMVVGGGVVWSFTGVGANCHAE